MIIMIIIIIIIIIIIVFIMIMIMVMIIMNMVIMITLKEPNVKYELPLERYHVLNTFCTYYRNLAVVLEKIPGSGVRLSHDELG